MVMAGRAYAENRPVCCPRPWGAGGPLTGVVQLPLRLDWSERTEFHLDDLAERNVMYERVIREATRPEDLRSYLTSRSSARSGVGCTCRLGTAEPGRPFSRLGLAA